MTKQKDAALHCAFDFIFNWPLFLLILSSSFHLFSFLPNLFLPFFFSLAPMRPHYQQITDSGDTMWQKCLEIIVGEKN